MNETLESLDNPTLYARRHELDRDALVASRLLTWADTWLDDKCDEFLGEMPALATEEAVLDVLERVVAGRLDECSGFVRHLARRLVRRPNPAAARVLRDLLERTNDPLSDAAHRAYGESVGCAALAVDPDHAIPVLLAQLDTPRETVASVSAVFVADPKTAFDRLGAALVLDARGADYQRRARLLRVLVADGIPDSFATRSRSSNARGFLAADDRWAAALLALAPDRTLFETRLALANVAPEVLDALRPKKKSAKPIPEATLVTLGTVEVADLGALPVLVDVRGELAMIATSPTSVTVRRLVAGLPLVAAIALPGDRRFATDAVGPNDSPYEAPGVLDAVLHPDGSAIALVAHGEVLLVAFDGSVRAESTLDDTLAHRACFGPDGKTLWIATNADDGHTVTALDGATLAVLGRTKNLGEFPDPAWFTAHPHPTDDVGVFAVVCGQDGSWVKVIERTARGFAPRKQKLHGNSTWSPIYGFHGDVVLTGLDHKLAVRAWPDLAVTKSTKLDGECRGGVVVGDHVLLAIADFSDAPSRLAVHSAVDGSRVAEARWPAGETLVERVSGAFVTTSAAGVTVRRVEVNAAAPKRGKARA